MFLKLPNINGYSFGIGFWKKTKRFRWKFGYYHIYYDGNNYSFHLGPLVFEWADYLVP